MTSSTKTLYTGHRFPPELISYTVWVYFLFPLSLRRASKTLGCPEKPGRAPETVGGL